MTDVADLTQRLSNLAQQVAILEDRIARLMAAFDNDDSLSIQNDPDCSRSGIARGRADLARKSVPPPPDPRLLRRIIRQRRLRTRYFEAELFGEPAWDILLDLAAARAEHCPVSVSSLCAAAAVPATTALRWIGQMEKMGLLVRTEDLNDRRRTFVDLNDDVAKALARYFDEIADTARFMV